MLTDERIDVLWQESMNPRRFARAVEAEAREDADECIKEQEDLLRELRAELDELQELVRVIVAVMVRIVRYGGENED